MMSCRYHTDQTDNDINSQVTDQSTLEIAATATAAGSRTSYVGGLQRRLASEKHGRGGGASFV